MLHIKNISKSFGGTRVLQDVSFEIPVGKVTALIGPNGAGKTTLFDVVTGAVRQDKGKITMERRKEEIKKSIDNEVDVSHLETYQRARLGISRTFQQVKLCENLTILDHFEMVKDNEDEKLLTNVIPGFDPESKNKKSRRPLGIGTPTEASEQKDFATNHYSLTTTHYKEFLHSLGINKPLETRVLDLSYGQRKLLDFGLALFRKHSILLLDEPVAGVNQIIRKIIHQQLETLKTQGETVLLIEHDIESVRAIADRVVVLDEGRVHTSGTPEEVFSNKQVMEAYLGE